ncbi:hypothetical protein L7F22_059884 [Adiantum nelumboides]|nr:hypothetical protein [Adiantum nelumboides]
MKRHFTGKTIDGRKALRDAKKCFICEERHFANKFPQRNSQEKDDKSDRKGKKPNPSAGLVSDLVGACANFISAELASKLGIRAEEMGMIGSAVSSLAQKPLPQIDAQIAEKIVRRWQAVKSQALGRDHAVKGLAEVLDGQMLENMSGRAQDAQNKGWYWDYKLTNLNIDSVTISTDGRRATVEATLWEGANLYDERTAQVLDSYQSSYTIRYELATINGRWKITSGIVLKS